MQGRPRPGRRPPHAHRPASRRLPLTRLATGALAAVLGYAALAGPGGAAIGALGTAVGLGMSPAPVPSAWQDTRSPAIGGPVTGSAAPTGDGTAAPATSGPPAASPANLGQGPGPILAAPIAGHLGLGLLIADRGNGRLLIVNQAGRTLWRFPIKGSLPRGQAFSADDAFVAADGRTIVANDEAHQVVDRIDIVSHRVIWQYGTYARAGSARGYLHTPDDAYPLANGDITVADIRNCRILEISRARRIVHEWGRPGRCTDHPPRSLSDPNGDTPLADGGMLITEIGGSRVIRLGARGQVRFDIHVPLAYPSDAQLDPNGNVLVVDYSAIGSVLEVSPHGHVLWRYRVTSGPGRLDHPSLAILLPDGTIAVNDDFRHRVVIIDPRTRRIVWQYGHTDRPGRARGYLFVPDGIDVVPLGTTL